MSTNIHPPIKIDEIEPITQGQVRRIFNRFEVKCLRGFLAKKPTQEVLEEEGDALVQDMFVLLRARVERRSNMIVRHFKVDRTKSRQEMLDATGRTQYVDKNVLATMPVDGPEEGDLYFFPVKRYLPFEEADKEFDSRCLIPDPAAQAQVNADDPSFADEHPNGVQWGLKNGVVSFLSFYRWHGGRDVDVNRCGSAWRDDTWLAGRRKNQ